MLKKQFTIAELVEITGLLEKRIRNIVTGNNLKTTNSQKGLLTVSLSDFLDAILKDKDDEKAWKIRKLKAEALQAEQKLVENRKEIRSDERAKLCLLMASYLVEIRNELSKIRIGNLPMDNLTKAFDNAITRIEERIVLEDDDVYQKPTQDDKGTDTDS